MYYEIVNNGKSRYLLFIHCICGNNKIFEDQFEYLKDYYNFILFDIPAHGNSRECGEEFTFQSIAQEVIQILKAEKIAQVDVISLSLGAVILDYLIRLAPKGMINKAVFTSTVIGFNYKSLDALFSFFSKCIRFLPRRIYMFFITFLMLPYRCVSNERKKFYKNSLHLPLKALQRYISLMSQYIFDIKDFNELRTRCIPLFVCGQLDFLFTPKLKKTLDSAIYAELKKANHLCNIRNEDFNSIIGKFLLN